MNIKKYEVVECNGKFEVRWADEHKPCTFTYLHEAQHHCGISNAILELRVAFLESIKPGQQLEVSGVFGDLVLTAVQTYSFGLSNYINLYYPEFALLPDVMICSYIDGLDVKYVSLDKYADLHYCYRAELLAEPVSAVPIAYLRCPICLQNGAFGHHLLSRLVCRHGWIQCTHCQECYPIVNGQPIMMTDTRFGQPEWREAKS